MRRSRIAPHHSYIPHISGKSIVVSPYRSGFCFIGVGVEGMCTDDSTISERRICNWPINHFLHFKMSPRFVLGTAVGRVSQVWKHFQISLFAVIGWRGDGLETLIIRIRVRHEWTTVADIIHALPVIRSPYLVIYVDIKKMPLQDLQGLHVGRNDEAWSLSVEQCEIQRPYGLASWSCGKSCVLNARSMS
jgi:hypothetical protein